MADTADTGATIGAETEAEVEVCSAVGVDTEGVNEVDGCRCRVWVWLVDTADAYVDADAEDV